MTPNPPSDPLLPDKLGFYGQYGGQYTAEILKPNLDELTQVFNSIVGDEHFWLEYCRELASFSGRPTPVMYAKNLTKHCQGAQIYLKREDLNHTGAHKINNVIGQGLLVKRLGKKRVIAETGAGQHGVATATMAARFGLEACVYMGSEDVARQRPNVFWMEHLGAEVISVTEGTCTLKDAINAALRDWASNVATTHYLLGTACGPHPFPALVSYLQSIVGIEARQQLLSMIQRLPDRVYACVGGGSNALALFQGFLHDSVQLVGVEAGGRGASPGEHASRMASKQARTGIAQGFKTLFLQNNDGQMVDTHSVAAGLDYVGVAPILADWFEQGKCRIIQATDAAVISAAQLLMQTEGIIPALESSHALAQAIAEAKTLSPDAVLLVNLSGRGDKDIFTMARTFQDKSWKSYLQSQVNQMSD